MFNQTLHKAVACLLLLAFTAQATLAQATKADAKQAEKIAAYKNRVIEWGVNKQLNVQLISGEKIAGRLAAINDQSIVVQTVQQEKITNRELPFTAIKKLSAKKNVGRAVGLTSLGVLAGFGALIGVLFAVYAATDN